MDGMDTSKEVGYVFAVGALARPFTAEKDGVRLRSRLAFPFFFPRPCSSERDPFSFLRASDFSNICRKFPLIPSLFFSRTIPVIAWFLITSFITNRKGWKLA